MEKDTGFTADYIIQISIVGVILLLACVWILLKIFRKNKKNSNSCCGCAIADSCKKKDILENYGKSKDLQRKDSRQSSVTSD